jgi:hypothetical protein
VDDAAWAALTLSLTVAGGIWTWFAFRKRGIGSGLRALAVTLLPLAAYLTNTLELATEIVTAVGDWAGTLALSPKVWLGVAIGGLSAALFFVSGRLRARQPRTGAKDKNLTNNGPSRSVGASVPQDDDMADIEALLRKRGIK